VVGVLLGLSLVAAPRSTASGPWPAGPPLTGGPPEPHVVPSDAAARIYLAQALASLARAEQLAQQAAQYGRIGALDIERLLQELRTISRGLQRFLVPDSQAPGPHLPVQITGQYLYDGLSRQPRTPAPRPHKESRP
jgi:RAQPRD family integrative conjugative element protein